MSNTENNTNEVANVTLESLIDSYNDELKKESPDANVLTEIEGKCREKCKELAKEMQKAKFADLLKYENPMMECARALEITVPTIKINREDGAIVSMEQDSAKRLLSPTAFTALLNRYNAKNDGFSATGVFANGSAWVYKAEGFAEKMTERVAKHLEVDKTAFDAIKSTYKLSENAVKNAGNVKVSNPTDNKPMVALLQEIIDAMVWYDPQNGGKNGIRCTNRDLAFLDKLFTGGDSNDRMTVRVKAGKKICDYIFTVAHSLITGESYCLSGFKQVEGAQAVKFAPFRDPMPESALRVVPVKDETAAA